MKELRIRITLKNNRLYSAVKDTGMTAKQFCKANNLPYNHYNGFVCLRICPFKTFRGQPTGEWKDTVLDFSKALGYSPEYLFPEDLMVIKKTKTEREMDTKELMELSFRDPVSIQNSSVQAWIDGEAKDIIIESVRQAVEQLSPVERDLIQNQFGIGKEGKEITKILAQKHGIAPDTAYGAINRALKKLKKVETLKALIRNSQKIDGDLV